MDAPITPDSRTNLSWPNILFGFSFIAFDALVSYVFDLKIGSSLVKASLRCVVQLAFMALILRSVFETQNPWAVAGIAGLLSVLGAVETVLNRSPRRYTHMFSTVCITMMTSTIPISIITTRFVMSVEPFWKPDEFIPIIGMLAGATVAGVVVATTLVLKEIHENRDKIETYLAFGASRREACTPIAQHALTMALMPTINQMSVMGIIAIPGMMTGAILGGSSVEQAAKLQMIIMFCISSSTALGSIMATFFCLSVITDSEHRIREERIDSTKHMLWKTRDKIVKGAVEKILEGWSRLRKREPMVGFDAGDTLELRQGLLSPNDR